MKNFATILTLAVGIQSFVHAETEYDNTKTMIYNKLKCTGLYDKLKSDYLNFGPDVHTRLRTVLESEKIDYDGNFEEVRFKDAYIYPAKLIITDDDGNVTKTKYKETYTHGRGTGLYDIWGEVIDRVFEVDLITEEDANGDFLSSELIYKVHDYNTFRDTNYRIKYNKYCEIEDIEFTTKNDDPLAKTDMDVSLKDSQHCLNVIKEYNKNFPLEIVRDDLAQNFPPEIELSARAFPNVSKSDMSAAVKKSSAKFCEFLDKNDIFNVTNSSSNYSPSASNRN